MSNLHIAFPRILISFSGYTPASQGRSSSTRADMRPAHISWRRTSRCHRISRHAFRRLQRFCYLHRCSGCFRREQLPGGACAHWKSAASSRRTPRVVFHEVTSDRLQVAACGLPPSTRNRYSLCSETAIAEKEADVVLLSPSMAVAIISAKSLPAALDRSNHGPLERSSLR